MSVSSIFNDYIITMNDTKDEVYITGTYRSYLFKGIALCEVIHDWHTCEHDANISTTGDNYAILCCHSGNVVELYADVTIAAFDQVGICEEHHNQLITKFWLSDLLEYFEVD